MEFISRDGTKEYGREYQITLITLFALKLSLDQQVRNVLIASNAKDYGAFKHALIRIDYEAKKSKVYAILFKYRMNEDSGITTEHFNNKDGDFSLQKYKESYHNFFKKKLEEESDAIMSGISADDVTLCLCTNSKVTGCNVFPIETSLLSCRISSSSSPNDFVGTNSKRFHRFQIINLPLHFVDDAEETEEDFFAQAIEEEPRADLFDNPDYVKFIQDRFLAILDEDELTDGSLLADLTKDELKIVACRFVQEKGRPSDDVSVRLKDYAERKFKLEKEQEYAEFFQRLLFYNNQANYKEAVQEVEDLLEALFNGRGIAKQLLEFVKAHFDEKSSSTKGINKSKLLHKKVVKLKLFELLSGIRDGEMLNAKYEVFKGITNMNDYTQRVRLLKEIKVSLQGRPPSSLYELTQESFHRIIPVPFILRNIKETVQVGLKESEKPDVYIKRRFHKVFLKRNVLWETTRNIFIFEVTPPSDLGVKIRELTYKEIGSCQFAPGDEDNLVTVARRGELDGLIQRIEAHHLLRSLPLHHLTVTSGSLEWRNSWRGAENLSKFIVDDDLPVPDHTVGEGDVLDYFAKPLNVISASPGMGKSTMLNVLLGYCRPDVLVLTLNLKTPCIHGTSDLLDCLGERAMSGKGDNEEFERGLFQFLKEERRLFLFIDAFDEVPATIIEHLQELKIPVWVFTRPNATTPLSEKPFSILPITLASLTREDIASYLTRALRAPPDEVNSFITDTFFTLFKTPLYLHELVNRSKEWRNLRALKVTDLHERFLELSFENYMRNYNASKEVNSTIAVFRAHQRRFFTVHRNAALIAVFGREFLVGNDILAVDDFQNVTEYFEDRTNNFELMTCLDEEGVPVFAHGVCAEYLAAVGILEYPKRDVLYEALLEKQFESIRILFDMMSAKDDHDLL